MGKGKIFRKESDIGFGERHNDFSKRDGRAGIYYGGGGWGGSDFLAR